MNFLQRTSAQEMRLPLKDPFCDIKSDAKTMYTLSLSQTANIVAIGIRDYDGCVRCEVFRGHPEY